MRGGDLVTTDYDPIAEQYKALEAATVANTYRGVQPDATDRSSDRPNRLGCGLW